MFTTELSYDYSFRGATKMLSINKNKIPNVNIPRLSINASASEWNILNKCSFMCEISSAKYALLELFVSSSSIIPRNTDVLNINSSSITSYNKNLMSNSIKNIKCECKSNKNIILT